ncbi:MAG: DUF1002 domain-containing protein [Eubacteriales bacterium]|nr:DUF1002 domain-containing protein [Eubacteriales bacterium]
MKKKLLSSTLLALSLALGCAVPAMADSRKVVTLGADLTTEQQNTMMRYFGVTSDAVDMIYITNTDERNHLGSYVPIEQIGTHTFSCALVSPTSSGGIQVKTANLSWVTCNMIASTLSTSGVTNCQVVAASPFVVSGTGALTGVIMAYENANRTTLDATKVDLANQELVVTGTLANDVGQSQATAVINETKLQVIENNITDIGEINNIINNVSNDYNVTVNPDQTQQIAALMSEIAQQEYDIVQLKATLERVQANVAADAGASAEVQQAAEDAAVKAEAAAAEANAQTQEAEQSGGFLSNLFGGGSDTEQTESEESILDNTNVEALEEAAGGLTVNEGDTTSTVQEQAEEQQAQSEDFGIPAATGDDSFTVDTPQELPADEGETIQTDPAAVDGTEPETTAVDGVASEPELKEEDLTDPTKKALYDEVKSGLEDTIKTTISDESGTVVSLSDSAATELPKMLEEHLLKILVKGVDAVAQEEAADTSVPAGIDVMLETAVDAPDKHYEDAQLAQMDRYVRKLVFWDPKEILADSYLEESDEIFLYNQIMKVLEKAYKVEPETETVGETVEEMPAPAEEAPAEEIPAAEDAVDPAADEFADFVEETGSF